MKRRFIGLGLVGCGVAGLLMLMAGAGRAAAASETQAESGPSTQRYQGMDIAVTGLDRARIVPLGDCPLGANIVRGVIKPGDPSEFVTVKIDVTVRSAVASGRLTKPVLHDAAGKAYRTAQAFTNPSAAPAFSCDFSFRVPTGTPVKSFAIEDVTFDLTALDK